MAAKDPITQQTLLNYRRMTSEERNREIPKHVFDAIKLSESQKRGIALPSLLGDIVGAQYQSGAIASSAQSLVEQAQEFQATKEHEQVRQIHKVSEITAAAAGESLTQPAPPPQKMSKVEEVIGQAAAKIARDVNANCVISIEKKEQEESVPNYIDVKVVVFKRLKTTFHKVEYHTQMRRLVSGSVIPIKELLMEAINKKYIAKDDRVVCVSDESVGSGYKGLLFIFDVDKVFFNMSMHHLADTISPEVLETVINLAIEIGNEGREGKTIGTAFVIGSPSQLSKHTRQMIINPFLSVPESQRRITDANLRETVKGFAQLDGVFVLNPEGFIISAGTHINLDMQEIDLSHLQGFGTRHRYCAGITKVTDAIAVVVSESGGVVRIFRNGELVMKLP